MQKIKNTLRDIGDLTKRMYDLSRSYTTERIFRYNEATPRLPPPLKTPRMSSAKDIPHLYVEKRLGNIGLLLAVSDASTSLCYCYIARNGGCIPPQRYRKARVPHRSNIIFRYGTGIGYIPVPLIPTIRQWRTTLWNEHVVWNALECKIFRERNATACSADRFWIGNNTNSIYFRMCSPR